MQQAICRDRASSHGRLSALASNVTHSNPLTLAISLVVLAIIAASEKIDARIPGALIGLVAASMAVVLMGLEHRGVSVLGVISVGLPAPAFPDVAVGQWFRLVPLGFIVALVIMVQTAATTRSFPSDADEPPDVNRDFMRLPETLLTELKLLANERDVPYQSLLKMYLADRVRTERRRVRARSS